jgi:hypothetical protein
MSQAKWPIEWGSHWGPIQLGASYADVLAALQQAKIEIAYEEEDPTWIDFADTDVELYFGNDEPNPLIEILATSAEFAPTRAAIVGEKLAQALRVCGYQASHATVWRLDRDTYDSLEAGSEEPTEPEAASDEDLLSGGTLWIRPLGVGLMLDNGKITACALRRPNSVPVNGNGPLTPAHLQFAGRDDLEQVLKAYARKATPRNWIVTLSTMAMFAAFGYITLLSIREQQQWHATPVIDGKVTAIEKDNGPHQRDTYVVEYDDRQGNPHQVRWTLADLYVPPQVGDTVEVRYLDEAPDAPIGPFQLRNIGFFRYVPYVLGVMGAYVLVLIIAKR